MDTNKYTCFLIPSNTHKRTHSQRSAYAHTHTHTNTRTYTHTHTHTHTHTYIHMHLQMLSNKPKEKEKQNLHPLVIYQLLISSQSCQSSTLLNSIYGYPLGRRLGNGSFVQWMGSSWRPARSWLMGNQSLFLWCFWPFIWLTFGRQRNH